MRAGPSGAGKAGDDAWLAELPEAVRKELTAHVPALRAAISAVEAARIHLAELTARFDSSGAVARGSPLARQLDGEADKLLALLESSIASAEKVRAETLAKKLSLAAADALAKRFGQPSPEEAAVSRFIFQFRGGVFARLENRGLFAPNVRKVSARIAAALASSFDTAHSSIDPKGAANVDHLASVYEGVLARAVTAAGRALTQSEVDRLALETVLTDATGKGRSPTELATMPLAPMVDPVAKVKVGNTGADFWKQSLQQAPHWEKMGFMAGTLMHGIPAFDTVRTFVRRAGLSDSAAAEVYAAVLGHHMSGFIAAGFSKARIRLDFPGMVSGSELTQADGASLRELYDAAIQLAGAWRDPIDAAGKRSEGPPSLTIAERKQYEGAAARFRSAIDALSEPVRSQLINDDTQQFTPVGMPKWILMMAGMAKPKSNQALIDAVYRTALQPYYEENLARGSGAAFYAASLRVAVRLGMKHEDDGDEHGRHFRAAIPGEPEHTQLAWQVVNDPQLGAAYLGGKGLSALPTLLPATEIVDWLRSSPPDPNALIRIAALDLPPAPIKAR